MGYALALLAGGALLGFLVFKVSTGPSTPPQQMVVGGGSFQAASAIPAALMPQVQEIASQFMCPCGGCDDSLDECACDMTNGATEVKGFIAQQLQAGVAKSRIITMVSQRYGGLKTGAAPGLDFKNVK
jgi:cytochrome c-type biogenesis protein CcmH/NrfF